MNLFISFILVMAAVHTYACITQASSPILSGSIMPDSILLQDLFYSGFIAESAIPKSLSTPFQEEKNILYWAGKTFQLP